MRHTIYAALLAGLTATPALAQDRPAITPTRDVAVTYRMAGGPAGTQGHEMRMSWQASSGLMRMDMPGGQGWAVVNPRDGGGSGFMVMEAQRMVMDLPRGQLPTGNMMPGASARFTREGTARIANTDCTLWRVEDQGRSSRACITSDGVMLRAESLSGDAQGAQIEATAVTFGPQDAARFQRPAGYQAFQMPAGVPGMPGAPAGALPRGTAIPPPGVAKP
ncbi:hypothetical protein [Roseococcus sp. YIM B11640]|uniref:hypothetical protein n=1 Tax=Roseococcus sp. YIM B11640 TaxID=3133973 RepID=UPI003C7E30CC